MRFKFCGDLDCPDWVLAEINILARLTSVKMKLLVNQVVKGLLSQDIDFAKVQKLTSDAKFDSGDMKASIAGIDFIISSATKHNVEPDTLSDELQQLGLPKEHANALCKSYESKRDDLLAEALRKSFRMTSQLKKVDWKLNPGKKGAERSVDLKILLVDPATNKEEIISFTTSATKLKVLLHEVEVIKGQMDSVQL